MKTAQRIKMGQDGTDGRPDRKEDDSVLTKVKPKLQKPSMYKVLLLNDDYTPMDFVVTVLQKFFGKNETEAVEIMMTVHRKGIGLCGIYTYEVAETKVSQVMAYAKKHEYPLQCTMEKE